jgi:uncharacterized protein (TIGR02466 family)
MTMSEMEKAQFGNLFGSPVLTHLWSDGAELNASLSQSILEHEGKHGGVELTNFGGWHSETGKLDFCGEAGLKLIGHFHEMAGEATRRLYAVFGRTPPQINWSFSAWANINRQGNFNQVHSHPGATWSGVYYVDHGEENEGAEGTALHLYDPNTARINLFFPDISAQDVLFKPVPGLMVVFPSYVPHAVLPHRGTRPRISIAFNLRKEPYP